MNGSCIIICFIVLSTIYSVADANCKEHGESCTKSCECTTRYCRDQYCIYWGESTDNDEGTDPCATYDCDEGSECVRNQVTCVKAPCRPEARCVKGAC